MIVTTMNRIAVWCLSVLPLLGGGIAFSGSPVAAEEVLPSLDVRFQTNQEGVRLPTKFLTFKSTYRHC